MGVEDPAAPLQGSSGQERLKGLGKGLNLPRAQRSGVRTLNDQAPIFVCPLFSIITSGSEGWGGRPLPFSVSRNWVPATVRGAI